MYPPNAIIKAAVSNATFGYDKLYSYRAPLDLQQPVQRGMRILVPFGKGNRKRVALVLDFDNSSDPNFLKKLKPFISIIDEKPLLCDEMIDMIFWMKETTLCTYFEAFRTIIPSGLGVQLSQKYALTGQQSASLTHDEQALFHFLTASKNQKEFDALLDCTGNEPKRAAVQGLLDKGIIEELSEIKRRIKDETVRMVRLSDSFSDTAPNTFSKKQQQIVELLQQNGAASVKEICYLCNVTSKVLSNLEKKDVISFYEYEVTIPSSAQSSEKVSDIVLSDTQQAVFDGILAMISKGEAGGALLHGITGSGKTSVFVKLIEFTLNLGKQAVMLIPEIALTPQMVQKFQNLFGETVAVVHSNLSLSQRLNEHKRIQSGDARIVVGTRSAVFAPLKNIGLIIMDEEGERTYKSESSPRYHARDIAKKRCAAHGAVLLMASATPSVESYFLAKAGLYSLFELTQRYSNATLPDVHIVDMGEEAAAGNTHLLSQVLTDEIYYNLQHQEQTILLLNRRGYNTYISCAKCREPVICPNCNVPLTYHKINGQLLCHYCGFHKEMMSKCEKCGSEHLKMTGEGTQKIEDELAKFFPDTKILRMDTDTTYSRYAYEKKFQAFARGDYDIMVGTQMIAKGLDFPNVTLVGVLSVDKALFAGDFRSYERTFSLITQVVGRSGRGEKHGRAFLQTYVPQHYVLNLAAQQDYTGFYAEEIALRKALIFPPYCDLCIIHFSSLIDAEADKASQTFFKLMKMKVTQSGVAFPLRVLGPAKCVYGKLNGKYRYRMILKCKNNADFRSFIREIYISTYKLKEFTNVNVFIDINGDIGV